MLATKLGVPAKLYGTGTCILPYESLNYLEDCRKGDLEDLLNILAKDYRIDVYPLAHLYMNINSWKDYEKLLFYLLLEDRS